jgi:hypothetical protein
VKSTARFIIMVCATVAVVGIVKARTVTLTMNKPEDATQRWDPPDAVAAYDTECRRGTVSAQCAALRGAVTFQIVSALENMSSFFEDGDEKVATTALDVREPEVKEAAMRVLNRKNDAAADPKLLAIVVGEPSWELQRLAADALQRSVSDKLRAVGSQWVENHPNQIGVVPHATLPALLWVDAPRPAPIDVGFAAYAGVTRYPPGESDRAIAFSTKDPIDKVVAFYAQSMKTKPLDFSDWATWVRDHMNVYYPAPDPRAFAEYQQRMQVKSAKAQKLVQEFIKTKDKKFEEQLQKLTAEMEADAKAFEAATPKAEDRPGVIPVKLAPAGNVSAKFFLEEKSKRAARVVCIYREDAIGATVIQLAWDPKVVAWKPRP